MSAGNPGPRQTALPSSPPPEAAHRAPLARKVVLVPQANLPGGSREDSGLAGGGACRGPERFCKPMVPTIRGVTAHRHLRGRGWKLAN